MKTGLGGLLVGKLGDLPAMFSSESGRGEFVCVFLWIFGLIGVHALPLFSVEAYCPTLVELVFLYMDLQILTTFVMSGI